MNYRSKKQLNQHNKQPVKDKSRVICPLTLQATGGRTATNYTVDWASTIELSEYNESGELLRREVGVWRSQAKNRAFEPEFRAALSSLKDEGKVTWEEDSYYFFDSEGQEAVLEYIDRVVRGELRGHARSWRGRFEKVAGVSIEELKADYPRLYGCDTNNVQPVSRSSDQQTELQDLADGRYIEVGSDSEVEVKVVADDKGRLTVIGGPDEDENSDWLNSEPAPDELFEIEKEASYEEAS